MYFLCEFGRKILLTSTSSNSNPAGLGFIFTGVPLAPNTLPVIHNYKFHFIQCSVDINLVKKFVKKKYVNCVNFTLKSKPL